MKTKKNTLVLSVLFSIEFMKEYRFFNLVMSIFMLALFSMSNGLRAQNSAQIIIGDMTLPCDALCHGTEGLSWGDNCPGSPDINIQVPAKNFKGEWWQAMTNWGQVYIPREGSSATNTRCQIRNVTSKLLKKDGTWITVQSDAFGGAAYVENFANNSCVSAGERDESGYGGGLSVLVGVKGWAGFNYHFYTSGRAFVDTSTVIGVYTSCEARLIVDDPRKPDDRATCKNILCMGADWWLNPTVGWLPDWSANSGIGGGRMKWVTTEWQVYNFCSLTKAEILANPPIDTAQVPTVNVTGILFNQSPVEIKKGFISKLAYAVSPSDATNKYVSK